MTKEYRGGRDSQGLSPPFRFVAINTLTVLALKTMEDQKDRLPYTLFISKDQWKISDNDPCPKRVL